MFFINKSNSHNGNVQAPPISNRINIFLGALSVFILVLHWVATYIFKWYQPDNHFDDFMHLLAGFWLGLIVIMLVKKYSLFTLENKFVINCLLIASLALTIGVFWELFEFSMDYLTRHFYNQSILPANVADTLGDLFYDFTGASLAALFFLKKDK